MACIGQIAGKKELVKKVVISGGYMNALRYCCILTIYLKDANSYADFSYLMQCLMTCGIDPWLANLSAALVKITVLYGLAGRDNAIVFMSICWCLELLNKYFFFCSIRFPRSRNYVLECNRYDMVAAPATTHPLKAITVRNDYLLYFIKVIIQLACLIP